MNGSDSIRNVLIGLIACFLATASAWSEDSKVAPKNEEGAKATSANADGQFLPKAGDNIAPETAVGKGASRSAGAGHPAFRLLVPQSSTASEGAQPVLRWELADNYDFGVLLEVVDTTGFSVENSFSEIMPGPQHKGVHWIDLEKNGFYLKNGIRYEWSVSLCIDRSCDNKRDMPRAFTTFTKKEITADSKQPDGFAEDG